MYIPVFPAWYSLVTGCGSTVKTADGATQTACTQVGPSHAACYAGPIKLAKFEGRGGGAAAEKLVYGSLLRNSARRYCIELDIAAAAPYRYA